MKKTLLFIAIFALTLGKISANPVDAQRAQKIGNGFLSAKALKTDIQLKLVYTSATRDAVDYYAFNVSNGDGFVIIAGDDRVKPVLAYSTTGSFDPSDLSDGFNFTLNSFRQEIQYVRENNFEATADIVAEWESVAENGIIKQSRNRAVVGPLCETTWHQNFPYNSQCPEDPEGHGGYTYAGCVATAMAQVMKFYDWPPVGTGSHTYTPDGYAQQTANFGETEYHFELMPLTLDSLSVEEDYYYIAQFQHHCGIAVDMQYSGHGSGAYSDDVPVALRNYFRYTCDDHITNYGGGWWGQGYSNEEWAQMLKDGGLDEGIPLYYSGQDDDWQGGHAFVCDGYDENDYFHFNWGWNGKDDAWCPIGALNTTKYHFNTMTGFTGHIIPNSPECMNRPEAITDFEVVENEDMTSVSITWTNPENNLNGQPLDDFTIYVYRDREIVFQSEGVKSGEKMNIVDMDLQPGLYKYSVLAENEAGFSKRSYFDILVGDKCDITFELTDEGGNGWKGACISVTDEKGQRIAKISMEDGFAQTIVMPLLRQNINFVWNQGWYHTSEFDTDYECAFVIKNSEDEVLYTSGEHFNGIFLTYDNDCEHAAVSEFTGSNVKVYPNPTNGILRVDGEGAMTISVINILGQKMFETTATDNATIDLNGCESGIYMVRIESANGIFTKKVNVRK